jgi:hypothetical protein
MSSLCSRLWPLKQRLEHRSVRDPETGCMLWTGCRTTNGYGNLTFKGRRWQAHRASWTVNRGAIPDGLLVCHRCDVRTCINPDHLFLGSQKENMADKVAKQGHERRTEDGPERRPSKSPEIMRIEMLGREFVTRVLAVRPLSPAAPVSARTPRRAVRSSRAMNAGRPRRCSRGREVVRSRVRGW